MYVFSSSLATPFEELRPLYIAQTNRAVATLDRSGWLQPLSIAQANRADAGAQALYRPAPLPPVCTIAANVSQTHIFRNSILLLMLSLFPSISVSFRQFPSVLVKFPSVFRATFLSVGYCSVIPVCFACNFITKFQKWANHIPLEVR